MTRRLKRWIAEQEKLSIARQQPVTTSSWQPRPPKITGISLDNSRLIRQSKIEEYFEEMFSIRSVQRLYNEDTSGIGQDVKKSNPSLFIKGGKTKGERKTKVLTLNKYMAMGPSGARCQKGPCWLVAGSKLLLCSALLGQNASSI
jgi:hypothetical protein